MLPETTWLIGRQGRELLPHTLSRLAELLESLLVSLTVAEVAHLPPKPLLAVDLLKVVSKGSGAVVQCPCSEHGNHRTVAGVLPRQDDREVGSNSISQLVQHPVVPELISVRLISSIQSPLTLMHIKLICQR